MNFANLSCTLGQTDYILRSTVKVTRKKYLATAYRSTSKTIYSFVFENASFKKIYQDNTLNPRTGGVTIPPLENGAAAAAAAASHLV